MASEDPQFESELAIPVGSGGIVELPCQMWRNGVEDRTYEEAAEDYRFAMAASGQVGDKEEALARIAVWDTLSPGEQRAFYLRRTLAARDELAERVRRAADLTDDLPHV